jgi:hypothetical protein
VEEAGPDLEKLVAAVNGDIARGRTVKIGVRGHCDLFAVRSLSLLPPELLCATLAPGCIIFPEEDLLLMLIDREQETKLMLVRRNLSRRLPGRVVPRGRLCFDDVRRDPLPPEYCRTVWG